MPSFVRAVIAALSLACGGCAYTGELLVRGNSIARHTADFDSAIAESDRQMIVANVLRARDRESMSFSRLSILHGSMTREISGGVGSEITEGRADDVFSPTFNVSDASAPTFDVPVLNTQKFSRAIHAEIELSTYHLLLTEGFQPGLLHTLFLSEMSLSCDLILDLNAAQQQGELLGLTGADITELQGGAAHCTASRAARLARLPGDTNAAQRAREDHAELIRFANDPTDWQPYEQFHRWLRIILSEQEATLTICPTEEENPVGPPIEAASATDIQGIVASSAADGLSWQEPDKGAPQQWRIMQGGVDHSFGLGCGPNRRRVAIQEEETPTEDPATPKNQPTGNGANPARATPPPLAHFQVRSVHDVMLYLGQVVRVRNFAGHGDVTVPRLDMMQPMREGRAAEYEWRPQLAANEDALFHLRTDRAYDGVTIEHHRQRYVAAYTPNGCPPENNGACSAQQPQDRTQQVTHLMLQLFGMLQERDDLPVSTVVSITR